MRLRGLSLTRRPVRPLGRLARSGPRWPCWQWHGSGKHPFCCGHGRGCRPAQGLWREFPGKMAGRRITAVQLCPFTPSMSVDLIQCLVSGSENKPSEGGTVGGYGPERRAQTVRPGGPCPRADVRSCSGEASASRGTDPDCPPFAADRRLADNDARPIVSVVADAGDRRCAPAAAGLGYPDRRGGGAAAPAGPAVRYRHPRSVGTDHHRAVPATDAGHPPVLSRYRRRTVPVPAHHQVAAMSLYRKLGAVSRSQAVSGAGR